MGGKSALQNELLGDLENELGSKMQEDLIDTSINKVSAPSYKKLGPISTSLISKLISAKMPGGFALSQIKAYLTQKFGLGEGRIEGVLLHSLSLEPANRLNSQGEAEAWLNSVVAGYSSKIGIPIGVAQEIPSNRFQSIMFTNCSDTRGCQYSSFAEFCSR